MNIRARASWPNLKYDKVPAWYRPEIVQYSDTVKIVGNYAYIGESYLGKLRGKALRVVTFGRIDEGYFIEESLNGYGRSTSDGIVKEGLFKKDLLNGYGKATYANGDYYCG